MQGPKIVGPPNLRDDAKHLASNQPLHRSMSRPMTVCTEAASNRLIHVLSRLRIVILISSNSLVFLNQNVAYAWCVVISF